MNGRRPAHARNGGGAEIGGRALVCPVVIAHEEEVPGRLAELGEGDAAPPKAKRWPERPNIVETRALSAHLSAEFRTTLAQNLEAASACRATGRVAPQTFPLEGRRRRGAVCPASARLRVPMEVGSMWDSKRP